MEGLDHFGGVGGNSTHRIFSMGPHGWHVLHELLTTKGTVLRKRKPKLIKVELFASVSVNGISKYLERSWDEFDIPHRTLHYH